MRIAKYKSALITIFVIIHLEYGRIIVAAVFIASCCLIVTPAGEHQYCIFRFFGKHLHSSAV